MDLQKKYRVMLWVAVALLALNVATIASLFYHTRMGNDAATVDRPEELNSEMEAIRAEMGARFFRDQLMLDSAQMGQFREINRKYNRSTHFIARELEFLRRDMVDVLGSDQPDTLKLNKIHNQIGKNHAELKRLTSDYYLEMKAVCTPEQQKILQEVFRGMVDREVPPGPGRGMGRGRPYRGGGRP